MASNTNGSSSYVPIRIPNETLTQIEAIVARSVTHRSDDPWTVSSWIKAAIADKLAHNERGRRKAKKLVPVQDEEIEQPEPGEIYAANQVA